MMDPNIWESGTAPAEVPPPMMGTETNSVVSAKDLPVSMPAIPPNRMATAKPPMMQGRYRTEARISSLRSMPKILPQHNAARAKLMNVPTMKSFEIFAISGGTSPYITRAEVPNRITMDPPPR